MKRTTSDDDKYYYLSYGEKICFGDEEFCHTNRCWVDVAPDGIGTKKGEDQHVRRRKLALD